MISYTQISWLLDQLPWLRSNDHVNEHFPDRRNNHPLVTISQSDLWFNWPHHQWKRDNKGVYTWVHSYLLDQVNSIIKEYLQSQGIYTPEVVIDLPKVPWSDVVINTKTLYELNKESWIEFKAWVDTLAKILQVWSNNLIEFTQQGIFINGSVSQIYLINHIKQLLDDSISYGYINYPWYDYQTNLLFEFSSPNMAKSMTLGHLRNTLIGQIMYNILRQTRCNILTWNYIGDRWTAFGKFITILYHLYDQDHTIIDRIISNPQAMMGEIYAQFKDCPIIDKEDRARIIVQLMEQGHPTIITLWEVIRELSLMDFQTVYSLINTHFDYSLGESFAVGLDNSVKDDLESHWILHESQWAIIIKLHYLWHGKRKPLTHDELDLRIEWTDQVMIYTKSDGSSLYAPRDLALLKWRTQTLWADKLIYVVGSEQSFYFQHLISLGEFLGRIHSWSMIHLSYGLYLQQGKKMSSRAGWTIWAYDLIQDIGQTIWEQSQWRVDSPTAIKLALSALIINDTKGDISKDVNLDIPSMTKLNGDTGIYIQYSRVRLGSLLNQIGGKTNLYDNVLESVWKTLQQDQILRQMIWLSSLLPLKIRESLDLMKPHILTQYLLELCGVFNKWYNDSPKVIDMNEHEKESIRIILSVYHYIVEKTMSLLQLPVDINKM